MQSLIAEPYYFTDDVFPTFQKPKIVGFFSLDEKRTYKPDASQLKFLPKATSAKVSYDLGHNLSRVIRKNGSDERLTNLLNFLYQSRNRLYYKNREETPNLEAAPFHCYRGLLTMIAASPYERDPWRILATLYDGKIYLCSVETQKQKERNRNLTERDLKFMSWGFKFEQYVLTDSPQGQPDISSPVNENEEFAVVFSTRLGPHRVIYGAEMDGIRADREEVKDTPDIKDVGEEGFIEYLSRNEFVELKTCRQIETSKQQYTFKRYKLLKWWLQSFLVGISTVISGFRDDHGQVRQLSHYDVREMPKIAGGTWKPNVCFSFCNKFLTFVKESFAREISRRHGDACHDLTKIRGELTLHFECMEDGNIVITDNYTDSDKILPDWFLASFSEVCDRMRHSIFM